MQSSLYIHIPYCRRKCRYCDFNSTDAPAIPLDAYIRLLLTEIDAALAARSLAPVPTLYVGGGTPSLLSPDQLGSVLAAVERGCGLAPAAEVTLEANPGTLTPAKLRGYLAAGVNRLSLGVQSLDDAQLRLLGRSHSAAEARGALAMAREAGCRNIGIDLMHALPGQRLPQWRQVLEDAVALEPEHIAAYGLSLEAGTPLAALVASGSLRLPDEETAAAMFELTIAVLTAAGYEHYEIANFARPGFRSRHNQVYWERGSYLGFGAGAHSFWRSSDYGIRWENPADLADYSVVAGTSAAAAGGTVLTRQEAMAEFFFLGLRLRAGVDLERFRAEFGVSAGAAFPGAIERHEAGGLLERHGSQLRLTARGLLLANRVMADFV